MRYRCVKRTFGWATVTYEFRFADEPIAILVNRPIRLTYSTYQDPKYILNGLYELRLVEVAGVAG